MGRREAELRITAGDGHVVLVSGENGLHRQDISGHVSAIKVDAEVGNVPVLTVTMPVPFLAAKFRGQVEVDDETAQALVALGWTPPAEPQPETSGDPNCPNREAHSVNGGPWRYCSCGWAEATP